MSDNHGNGNRVLSQGVISMLAYGVNFIASFFAIIGMMRIMGKEPYGMFALAIQITAFTAMLADFGLGPVIMRRMAIAPGRAASIVLEATYARLLLMLPAWLLTLGIGWALEPGWTFFMMLNLMLCNLLISSKIPVLRGTLDSLYRSQSRMGIPTITMAVDSLVLLLIVILMPMYFRDPVQAMMLYTASNLIGAAALVIGSTSFARRISTEPARVSWAGVRELLKASSPLAVFLLLNALHVSIDTVYLKIFHGNEEVGVFNAALRIMFPLAVFPAIISIATAPHFARASAPGSEEQGERVTRLFSLSVKTLLVGSVLLAGFGATNARELIAVALKNRFDEAVVPMMVLFAMFLPMSLNMFLVELNNARDNIITNTRAAALLAAVSVAVGIPLVMYFSATGAAVTKLVATVAGLAFLIGRSREGIIFAMKPIVLKAGILLLLLIAVRLLLSDLHVLLSNGITLVVVMAGIFALKMFTADELLQWKTQFAVVFRRRV